MRHKVIKVFFRVNLVVTFLCIIAFGFVILGMDDSALDTYGTVVMVVLLCSWAAWMVFYITYGILEIRNSRKKDNGRDISETDQ